jgi:hypothetical protein
VFQAHPLGFGKKTQYKLQLQIKELNEYLETIMATKRESRDHSLKNLENIKDFSTRFLDALIIRNGKLCFNEK